MAHISNKRNQEGLTDVDCVPGKLRRFNTHTQPQSPQLEVFLDTSANVALGWGAWCGTKWIWGGWDQTFFNVHNPSIDFLRLYAVVVAIFAWSDLMANKHVIVHSDNTLTVAVINDKFADPHPSPCPSYLYPLSEHTYSNLQL